MTAQAPVDIDQLVEALDHTPSTVTRLARELDADPEAIEAALEDAQARGWAICWGEVWATTWRAKLRLAPRFFAIWIPTSLALGGSLTALALTLHAQEVPTWLFGGLIVVTALAGMGALLPIVADGDR